MLTKTPQDKFKAIQQRYPGFKLEVEYQLHATFIDVCRLSNRTFIEYILDLIPDPEARTKMIHAEADEAFCAVADSADDQREILGLLLDLTEDKEQKKLMLLRALRIEPFPIPSMAVYLQAKAKEIGVIYEPPLPPPPQVVYEASTADVAINSNEPEAEIELPAAVVKGVEGALLSRQVPESFIR